MAHNNCAVILPADQLQLHLQASKALLDSCFQARQHKTIRRAVTELIEKLQIDCPLEKEACVALSKKLSNINLQISQQKRIEESFHTHLNQTHAAFCQDAVIEFVGLPPPH